MGIHSPEALEDAGIDPGPAKPQERAARGFGVAYDRLADRVRDLMPEAIERKMFGGVGWMENGNLVVGVMGDELIARIGPDAHKAVASEPGVRPFDPGKAPMKGWVLVAQEQLPEDEDVARWVARARRFVRTLPAK
ncbi:MAG: TfoX/Sxy family protein [Thermoplasmatota archaeon]|nr:TfoX/Sxy family protein [Halobacteriales archaeon]